MIITFGSTYHYGFHALEVAQALAEQRRGGETGIVSVQCLTDGAVWAAMDAEVFSREVFDAVWDWLPRHLNRDRPLQEVVPKPVLFLLTHADGLRVAVIELNGAAGEWAGAWRYAGGEIKACQFWTDSLGTPGSSLALRLARMPGWSLALPYKTSNQPTDSLPTLGSKVLPACSVATIPAAKGRTRLGFHE